MEALRSSPIWEEIRDFGSGSRLYRCLDISSFIGQSIFEYFNPKLGWRRVNNFDVREAMHRYTTEKFRGAVTTPIVHQIEGSEGVIRLSVGGVEVCAHRDGSPQATALLKFDAERL